MYCNIVFLVFVIGTFVDTRTLPSYIPTCRRSHPDFSLCTMKAAESLRPHLAKGIKELNIPALEPLEIPMIKLEQGTSAINYKATLTNLQIHGLSNFNFLKFTSDFSKKFRMRGMVEFPFMMLEANCVISGKALVVPIQGNGLFMANITNCVADVDITADIVKKKNVEYLNIKDTVVKLEFGTIKAKFDKLFDGDQILGQTTNNFIHNNVRELAEEVKPAIEAVATMLLDDIASKILKTLPVEKLFPS